MKIVINTCFGGFSLSQKAYERLIELGIPVRAYEEEKRNPKTGLYDNKPENNRGEVIFDSTLSDNPMTRMFGRYWESWTSDHENRTHPLIIQVVEELSEKANGRCAQLKVVEIPNGMDWEIDEYDGSETVHESHRSWS